MPEYDFFKSLLLKKDVIIEDVVPPEDETEEGYEREGYFEIEFR